MAAAWVVTWPLGALGAGIVVQILLGRVLSARAKGWLALAAVAAAWPLVARGGPGLDVNLGAWDGPVQLAYRVDGLALFFALMGAGIGAAVLLYAVGYMAHEPRGTTRFYCLVLVFIAGLIHLVYAADLFLVYLSWEVVGLCSFLLVSFWYQQPEAHHHVADLADRRVGEEPLQIALHQHEERASHQRDGAQPRDGGAPRRRPRAEGVQAGDEVDAGLDVAGRVEQRADGRRRRHRVRDPGVQRELHRLGEGRHQHEQEDSRGERALHARVGPQRRAGPRLDQEHGREQAVAGQVGHH